MDKLVQFIADEVKNHSAKLDRLEIILERNTSSLEEHMRRTLALEDHFKPVQADHAFFRSILRMGKIIASIVGAGAVLVGLARTFNLL